MFLTFRRGTVVVLGILLGLGFAALVYQASSGLEVHAAASSAIPTVLRSVHIQRPEIALTFDDGPDPANTPKLLAALREHHVHATFFVLGSQVRRYPGLTEEISREGNELADHGMSHRSLVAMRPTKIAYELQATADLIRELSGQPPAFMRPPYGSLNQVVVQKAHDLHMTVVLWTIDTRDWMGLSPGSIVNTVLSQLRPGSIVLMHDGGGPRSKTVQAVAALLDDLSARGYRAVTMENLLHDAQSSPIRSAAQQASP